MGILGIAGKASVFGLIVALGAVAGAASATPSNTQTAMVVHRPPTGTDISSPVSVGIIGLNRYTPTSVAWGDGGFESTVAPCSVKEAKKRKNKCSKTLTHKYSKPGKKTITVRQGRRTLGVYQITVIQPPDLMVWRNDMLRQVNAVRAAGGKPPLTLCPTLNKAAQDYADEMANGYWFAHDSKDGTSPWQRIARAGYGDHGSGENIAMGQGSVDEVMNDWINSPSHYANLMGRSDHVGFGYAKDGTGQTRWVQVFGRGGTC